jgi:hypothetical protein
LRRTHHAQSRLRHVYEHMDEYGLGAGSDTQWRWRDDV